jgi:hypothetical protein
MAEQSSDSRCNRPGCRHQHAETDQASNASECDRRGDKADGGCCGAAGCDCHHAEADNDGCGAAGCDCHHAEADGEACGGCDADDAEHGCCGGCSCGESTIEEDTAWLEEHAPAVDDPTPEPIVELVVACVHFVKDALDIELDFTAETLPVLDHYLAMARQSLSERTELRELIWRFAGAYFGELVRRRYNGFWHLPSLDVHTWRLQQRQVLLSFNPVGAVAEAMAGSESSDGPTGALRLARADQQHVAERLALIPPLPEDQYFLLSTRLEVIDTVIEHLRVCMNESDQAEFEFDPDDYANDLMPLGAA